MSETPDPIHERINSRAGLEAGIDRILPLSRRRIFVFAGALGPAWNQPSRVDVLRRFCLESRRGQIRVLLHDPVPAYSKAPRLVDLLRQFSHVLTIHETPHQAKGVYDPFAISDDRHYVHRFHLNRGVGILALDDPVGAKALLDRFEELWAVSEPAISATTLGL